MACPVTLLAIRGAVIAASTSGTKLGLGFVAHDAGIFRLKGRREGVGYG